MRGMCPRGAACTSPHPSRRTWTPVERMEELGLLDVDPRARVALLDHDEKEGLWLVENALHERDPGAWLLREIARSRSRTLELVTTAAERAEDLNLDLSVEAFRFLETAEPLTALELVELAYLADVRDPSAHILRADDRPGAEVPSATPAR